MHAHGGVAKVQFFGYGEAFAQACIGAGTRFTAVGVDVGLLARHADELRARFK